MKLKKINATLGLVSIATMLVHIGYTDYAYLAFYYNPTLKQLTSLPFMVITCLHAVCGMAAGTSICAVVLAKGLPLTRKKRIAPAAAASSASPQASRIHRFFPPFSGSAPSASSGIRLASGAGTNGGTGVCFGSVAFT